ncbi:MAG: hypothetical protein ACR2NB_02660 [Solirubrobacteraceae bacterium]
MRLRLVLPRRGRGRGFRRLAAAAAALAVAIAIGFAVGRVTAPSPRREPERARVAPPPAATPTPGARVVEGDGTLAVGITEDNPAFLAGSDQPAFERWHRALAAIRPTYYRLVVDWAKSVRPDGSFDVAHPQGGCLRALPPCAGFAGVRAQLRAVAAAQRAAPGRFRVMVVFTDTPARFARPPGGCERADTAPRSRPPRTDALPAYQDAIHAIAAEARAAGMEIPYWSPWNEPNHPYFLSPQRTRCSPGVPSAAVGPYVEMARAMRAVLDAEPGDQQLVLGETAGLLRPGPTSTRLPEFIRALPRDVACGATVYGQHAYVGGDDPVAAVARALAPFRCRRTKPIWITETGAKTDRFTADAACRGVHRRLVRWYRDPRVTAAFQYTLREDDRYPTGLVTTDLGAAYPALAEWQAWGARPDPAAAPPRPRC